MERGSNVILKALEVPGYFASDEGFIYSAHRKCGKIDGPLRRVVGGFWSANSARYYRVSLYQDGKCIRKESVHVLICEAFHGPKPSDAHQVCHFDDVSRNNVPANLSWGLPKKNGEDRVRNELQVVGEAHWSAKLTERQAITLKDEIRCKADTVSGLARKYNVSRKLIRMIRSGRAWAYLDRKVAVWPTT